MCARPKLRKLIVKHSVRRARGALKRAFLFARKRARGARAAQKRKLVFILPPRPDVKNLT